MKRKTITFLLAVCLIITLLPQTAPAAADVTINGTSGFWAKQIYGSYVEYTMDGVNYNSQTASPAINRQAWSRMSQEQKRVMYEALAGNASRQQMGLDGAEEMVNWFRSTSKWYEAHREWQRRMAKRDFPDLETFFVENSLGTLASDYDAMAAHEIPFALTETAEARAYATALTNVQYTWELGKQYYEQAVKMRTKGIASVVNYTVVQCTSMLTDMLFIPAVAQMAAGKFSSEAADFINVMLQAMAEENASTAEKIRKYQRVTPRWNWTPSTRWSCTPPPWIPMRSLRGRRGTPCPAT